MIVNQTFLSLPMKQFSIHFLFSEFPKPDDKTNMWQKFLFGLWRIDGKKNAISVWDTRSR
jgi:hypothetical protein